MPEISALRRLSQEDPRLEANMGYTARPYVKSKTRA